MEKIMIEYFAIPINCPCCGQSTIIKGDFLICENPNCEGKLINKLDHFCGKKGLDIKGISKATLEKLIDWGWVSCPTDIFKLSQYKNEWIQKPGFGEKSVEKILNAIGAAAACELSQFIAAIGIPLIGAGTAKELVKTFPTWKDLIEAVNNNYPFYEIPNFGNELHFSLHNFDYNEANYIANTFITFKTSDSINESSQELNGKIFTITGKLTHFKNRDELVSIIQSKGGKVTSSVSKNTSYLINNDINSDSSKNRTAKSLNVPIISEEDFIQTFSI